MEHVRSAAVNFLVPAGCVYDPPEYAGIGSVLSDLITLRKLHYPTPLGQDRRGTPEGIEAITPRAVQAHYRRLFQPQGTILSVAGNIEWQPLLDLVGRLFGDWKPGEQPALKLGSKPAQRGHIAKETTQTQIALAYPRAPIGDPDYYAGLG